MLRTLYNFTNTGRRRKNLWINLVQRCSTGTDSMIENNEILFAENEHQILKIVNESNLKQLTNYIEQSYAQTIILHRITNGSYKSLSDLTCIKDMESDILNKFLISVTNHDIKHLQCSRSVLIPNTKITKIPNEIMGLHIGPTAICWALVTSDFKVLHLGCHIWNDNHKKFSSYDLIHLASSVAHMLPLSSSHVIEEIPVLKRVPQSTYYIPQQLTTAIMSSIIIMNNSKNDDSSGLKYNLYVLKPQTSAHFFNLVVGKEVVASKYIIQRIFDQSNIDNKQFQYIHISDELREYFLMEMPEQQEQLGWSLLKALTCTHLLKSFMARQKKNA
ncbi:PREDICTED: uncharacterized protein LOC108571891 [Habropoda laboriosa]|uniref:uncharacterized protein LOC108571891 n=1 Tax=Habropoda laboriosa TaxID=597456 RepID=UPI00083DA0AA|nr:PREDICTED: uncharacterized protein LOC108571891 [Habropoda laboriosa]